MIYTISAAQADNFTQVGTLACQNRTGVCSCDAYRILSCVDPGWIASIAAIMGEK